MLYLHDIRREPPGRARAEGAAPLPRSRWRRRWLAGGDDALPGNEGLSCRACRGRAPGDQAICSGATLLRRLSLSIARGERHPIASRPISVPQTAPGDHGSPSMSIPIQSGGAEARRRGNTDFQLFPEGPQLRVLPECPKSLRRTRYQLGDVTPFAMHEHTRAGDIFTGDDWPSRTQVLVRCFDTRHLSPAAQAALRGYARGVQAVTHRALLTAWVIFQDGPFAVFLHCPEPGAVPVQQYIREHRDNLSEWDVLRTVVLPLCQALTHLHSKGFLYGPLSGAPRAVRACQRPWVLSVVPYPSPSPRLRPQSPTWPWWMAQAAHASRWAGTRRPCGSSRCRGAA